MTEAQTQPTLVPETPPDVTKTAEILKKAAETAGASKLNATIAAMSVAVEHKAPGEPED